MRPLPLLLLLCAAAAVLAPCAATGASAQATLPTPIVRPGLVQAEPTLSEKMKDSKLAQEAKLKWSAKEQIVPPAYSYRLSVPRTRMSTPALQPVLTPTIPPRPLRGNVPIVPPFAEPSLVLPEPVAQPQVKPLPVKGVTKVSPVLSEHHDRLASIAPVVKPLVEHDHEHLGVAPACPVGMASIVLTKLQGKAVKYGGIDALGLGADSDVMLPLMMRGIKQVICVEPARAEKIALALASPLLMHEHEHMMRQHLRIRVARLEKKLAGLMSRLAGGDACQRELLITRMKLAKLRARMHSAPIVTPQPRFTLPATQPIVHTRPLLTKLRPKVVSKVKLQAPVTKPIVTLPAHPAEIELTKPLGLPLEEPAYGPVIEPAPIAPVEMQQPELPKRAKTKAKEDKHAEKKEEGEGEEEEEEEEEEETEKKKEKTEKSKKKSEKKSKQKKKEEEE